MTWRERLRAVRMDVTPLRGSRDFRLLFAAGTVFYLGGMMTYVAIPYQVYTLTGSNFAVGAIGLVELVPLVVFGLYGGALADHVDRRRLLIWTGVAQAAFTAVLAVNAFLDHPSVPLIFLVSALLASSSSLQRPSREALMPRTVRHDQIAAANALTSLGMQVGVLVGPAVGGLLVAYVGTGWCFVADIGGLVVASLLYVAMRPYPHREETTPPSLAGIGQGLRYAFSRRDLLGTYLVDIAAMLLALPVVLFPALAQEVFGRPQLLGLLYSAETVGALLATALSGWTSRVHHHGRAIVLAAAAYGACVAAAGVMPGLWLVAAFLMLSGAADMVSGVFRGTVWNQTIPEGMRGRLAGIEMLSYSLGPLGGQVRAGATADLWTVRGSIASGGLACVAGVGLTALALRDFWSYDARTDVHAVAERAARQRAGEGTEPAT
ncbi:MFS transporter [Nocardioides panaciterrulae]|uniref:MFS family permease n=1 Tax=Nocardioides panaciterrulae TaxID=661492 RepID=A0A7Y9J974_9ACTN|nr:MFS transporter [Nocardioides panaciterrulae]NYD40297.1 MFS family permease [Nocardioides panaciterrulae]